MSHSEFSKRQDRARLGALWSTTLHVTGPSLWAWYLNPSTTTKTFLDTKFGCTNTRCCLHWEKKWLLTFSLLNKSSAIASICFLLFSSFKDSATSSFMQSDSLPLIKDETETYDLRDHDWTENELGLLAKAVLTCTDEVRTVSDCRSCSRTLYLSAVQF